MKWLFYEIEASDRARVDLIYYQEPQDKTMYHDYIEVEELTEAEIIESKYAVLYCNPETGEYWYEYEDIPLSKEELQADKIQELENALLEMSTLQAIKDIENERAIMELTMMIGGM